MIDRQATFTEACITAFEILVERYDFSQPEIEPIGREMFVRYHKGNRTISVAYEPGCAPIVELFYSAAETGEPPVPWAAQGGVARCRRFPRLDVREAFAEDEASSFNRYLRASARALEQVEHEWLAA